MIVFNILLDSGPSVDVILTHTIQHKFCVSQTPTLTLPRGGLAHPDPDEVRRIACRALRLFQGPRNAGHLHAQSMRFLDPAWTGLHPGDPHDPPLRSLIEMLASGEATMHDFIVGNSESERSLLRWVSAFRLAPCLVIWCLEPMFVRNGSR